MTGPVTMFAEPRSSYFAYVYEAQGVLNQLAFLHRGYCATANLLVAHDVFVRVGAFDEHLFSGGDLEWGNRALRADVPILYDEQVRVLHPTRTTVRQVLKRKRRFAGAAAQQPENNTWVYLRSRFRPASWRSLKDGPRSRFEARKEALSFLLVVWLVRINEVIEFLLVRWGIKGPNRA